MDIFFSKELIGCQPIECAIWVRFYEHFMETLCFENNDNFKNIMGFPKEKMCPQGWIVV
jgi:hypothetical protein